jgi:two-component system, NtrC family, sensor kinase
MRLLPKLTLGILAAAVVPLAIAGSCSERLSRRTLRARIQQDHAALAANAADGVERFFAGLRTSLSIPQALDYKSAPPMAITGALQLSYRSSDDLAIVALLDEKGEEVVGAVYLTNPDSAGDLANRPAVSDADRDAFLARVPWRAALAGQEAIGDVVVAGSSPRVAVATSFSNGGRKLVVAADVSLERLGQQLAGLSVGGTQVVLVDGQRRRVAGGAPPFRPLEGVALPDDRDPAGPLPKDLSVATVKPRGQAAALAAFAPAAGTGFGVVVTQPEREAFAHASDLRARTFFWLGVAALIALIVGIGLASDFSRRVGNLVATTVTLGRGKFDARLDATGGDELAELARAFNRMTAELGKASDEIRKQNATITAKNEEITRWNRELERRVEDKTRELRDAQELMLRARSLTAIGTLGAGIAHEINNPLTGVIGGTQLLLMDAPPGHSQRPLLEDIETQAQRIRAIVANMLRLAQQESGAELVPVDLNRVIDDALELVGREELKKSRIDVECRYAPALPTVRGNPVLLQEAVIELVTNARRAMPRGGTLTLATQLAAGEKRLVALRVSDTGNGIKQEIIEKIFDPFFTTKENWSSTGMGLTMVHKIVEEHHGKIAVDSPNGSGASFTMTFPADRGRTHLD